MHAVSLAPAVVFLHYRGNAFSTARLPRKKRFQALNVCRKLVE